MTLIEKESNFVHDLRFGIMPWKWSLPQTLEKFLGFNIAMLSVGEAKTLLEGDSGRYKSEGFRGNTASLTRFLFSDRLLVETVLDRHFRNFQKKQMERMVVINLFSIH